MKFAVTAKCPQCNRGHALYVFSGAETNMHMVRCNVCTREMFRAGALPDPVGSPFVGHTFMIPIQPTSDPLNVSVAEKGPAEQFDEPQIVHDSK